MCIGKKPQIEKADPVAPPPPVADKPTAPVLNETSRTANAEGESAAAARRGRKALTIPLAQTGATGINIPR